MKKKPGVFLSVILCAVLALFSACGGNAGESHSYGCSSGRSEAISEDANPSELESNETPRIPLD